MQMSEHSSGGYHTHQEAVVFITHILDETVLDRFEKLDREAPSGTDVYFLLDLANKTNNELRRARKAVGEQLVLFDETDITDVEFPNPWADPTQRDLTPGNLDLLYLYFGTARPDYSRYWFIEYDVVYTGSWMDIFQAFEHSDVDLLGTTLQPHAVRPSWYWWPTFSPGSAISISEQLCGFFPVVRLSKEMLNQLSAGYQAGWSGHFEAVLPTLARHEGLSIEDIGGEGPYVDDENNNRFYINTIQSENLSPGTFVYRPARSQPGTTSGSSGKLWHPIKP